MEPGRAGARGGGGPGARPRGGGTATPRFQAPYLGALLPGTFIAQVARASGAEVAGLSFHALVYGLLGLSAAVIALAACAWRRARGGRPPLAAMRAIDVPACLMCVAGACLACSEGAAGGGLAALSAGMACFGTAWVDLRWGALLSRLETGDLLKAVIVDMMFGCLVLPFLTLMTSAGHAGRPWLAALACCLPIAFSATMLPLAERRALGFEAPAEVLYEGEGLLGFGGIAFGAVAYSVTLMLRGRLDYGYDGLTGIVPNIMAGALVGLAYVWLFVMRGSPNLFAVFRVMVVAFAAGALVAPLASGTAALLVDGVMGTVVIVVLNAFLPICAYVSRHSRVSPFTAFGLCYAIYGLPRFLEPALDAATAGVDYLGGGPEGFYNALILFCSAAALAFSLVRTPPGMPSLFGDYLSPSAASAGASGGDASMDEEARFRRALGRVASERGLTEREAQVMELVCHGRSKSYIADTMLVSENTVKAYSKSLYVKLGVHSKQELIDMVETCAAEAGGR